MRRSIPICLLGLLVLCTFVAAVVGSRGAPTRLNGTSGVSAGWTRVNISLPGGPEFSQAGAIGCSSPSDCIIAGVRGQDGATWTLTTTDGGQSFAIKSHFPVALAGGVASISCDQNGCFMVGENLAENADALGFSTNLGRTWSVVALPQKWIAESITPDFVGCTSNTCVVYGTNIFSISDTTSLSNYRVGLITTSDNGATWTSDPYPGGSNDLDSIACVWTGTCWALYRSDGQPAEGVAVSFTNGRSWTTVGGIPNSFDPDHFVGFGCATRADCLLVDDSDDVYASTDGGRTWIHRDPVRDANGSTNLETDALGCAPVSGRCFVVGASRTDSLWSSN
jgi:hypothetical protein